MAGLLDRDHYPENLLNRVDELDQEVKGLARRLLGGGGSGGTRSVSADLSGEPFVVMSQSLRLSAERVLTAGDSISVTDGGVGTTVTLDLETPGTVTVSSTNAAAAPHTHQVTSSSNPGAAASLLASDASGYLQLTGMGIGAAPGSADLHFASGVGITHADGVTAGNFLRANGTRYVPDTLDIDDITDLAYATPNLTLSTSNAAGAASSVIRSDATIAVFDATNPTTITVSSTPAPGSAGVAARRDHEHGIATSSAPGAAASILASSAAGALTLVDLTLSSLTASTVIYADGTKKIVSLANASGYLKNDGAGSLSWDAGTVTPHDILSASHSDTLAAAVTDGDIIIGNGTPKWSELAISVPAANVRNVLGVDNGETRPSWKTALDNTNPVTLTVSTAAAPGTSLVFSHRDHAHAITSSSAPGAAASILASSAAGALTLVNLTLSSLTASTVIYSNASKQITSLANASGYLTNNGAGSLSWSSTATPAAHVLLSASHSDTLAGAVVDGDVMIGNATPKWSRLARSVPAANVRNVLGIDNGETRPSWKTALDATNPTTLTVSTAAAPGTSLVFSHRDHAHPITSSSNPGAAASLLASSAAGLLTLVQLNTDTISDRSGGNLTISPTGDIILNPTGNDILPTTNWDLTFGSVSKKYVDLHLGELTAGHIVAPSTASGIAGRTIIAPTCLFAADLSSGTTNSAEKLSNTGFETAGGGGADVFANWTESAGDGAITQDASVYHGGTKSCKLVSGATSNTLVYQAGAVAEGTRVIFGFWTQGDGTNAGRYRVYDVDNAGDIIAVTSTGVTAATWTKVWVDFEVPVDCTSARFYFYCPAVNAAYAYFDDVTAKTGVQITVTDDDMADVDIAYAEAGGNVEWFEIASAASGAGPYTYWVLRNLDGGGANTWYAGDGLHSTGTTDEGYIDIYSVDSILGTTTNGAAIVGGLRGSPTYNDIDEVWQLSSKKGLTFLGQGTTDANRSISWRETDFAGDVIAYMSTVWDGGAADDIDTYLITYKATGLSAGDAVLNLSAWDVDAGREVRIYISSEGWCGTLYPLLIGGTTLNSNQTDGITIDQSTADDEAFAIKSSTDVAHGGFQTDTNTYFTVSKVEGAAGGSALSGYKDSAGVAGAAMLVRGYLDENVSTTKSTSGLAVVHAEGFETSGGAIANTVADGNVFCVRTWRGGGAVTLMIVDEDGDLHLDAGAGTGGTIHGWVFDDYDDMALLTGLRASTAPEGHELRKRFGEFIDYARPILEETGVVHYNDDQDEDGRPFVSMRGLQYLSIDAMRQFYDLTVGELQQLKERCQRYEQALAALGVDRALLEGGA